jgi:hypothetical protein
MNGLVQFSWDYNPFGESPLCEFFFEPDKIDDIYPEGEVPTPQMNLDIGKDYLVTDVPHWFLVLVSALSGALPCLRCRFSLRTLLIATTIIGLALGLIIATTR